MLGVSVNSACNIRIHIKPPKYGVTYVSLSERKTYFRLIKELLNHKSYHACVKNLIQPEELLKNSRTKVKIPIKPQQCANIVTLTLEVNYSKNWISEHVHVIVYATVYVIFLELCHTL